MTKELDEFLESSFKMRRILQQVLSSEAVDYLLDLVARDKAHRKYLKFMEEDNYEQSDIKQAAESNQSADKS